MLRRFILLINWLLLMNIVEAGYKKMTITLVSTSYLFLDIFTASIRSYYREHVPLMYYSGYSSAVPSSHDHMPIKAMQTLRMTGATL